MKLKFIFLLKIFFSPGFRWKKKIKKIFLKNFFCNLFFFSSIFIVFLSGFRKLSFHFFSIQFQTHKKVILVVSQKIKNNLLKSFFFFFILKFHFFSPQKVFPFSHQKKKKKFPEKNFVILLFYLFHTEEKIYRIIFHSVLVNLFPLSLISPGFRNLKKVFFLKNFFPVILLVRRTKCPEECFLHSVSHMKTDTFFPPQSFSFIYTEKINLFCFFTHKQSP